MEQVPFDWVFLVDRLNNSVRVDLLDAKPLGVDVTYAKHLARTGGGMLSAATVVVPWAILHETLIPTFFRMLAVGGVCGSGL